VDGLKQYFAALFAMLVVTAGGVLFLKFASTGECGIALSGNFLRFEDGVTSREDPITKDVLHALFPGYEQIIASIRPSLNSKDEFALTSVLVGEDRKGLVRIPLELPFLLLDEKAPDVIIFGTSRARDGINPSILAKELGSCSVLNLAVSGASMSTIRLLMKQVLIRQKHKAKLAIICIDDPSFSNRPERIREWDRLIEKLTSKDGRLSSLHRIYAEIVDNLTYRRKDRVLSLNDFPRLAPCLDKEAVRREITPESNPEQRFMTGISSVEVASFEEVSQLAGSLADTVIYLVMPVTAKYKTHVKCFDYLSVVKRRLGVNFINYPMEVYGLSDHDYFGAKGKGNCNMDLHHLNPLGAVKFTTALANIIKDSHDIFVD